MTKTSSYKLNLLDAANPLLNCISEEVKPEEVASRHIQNVINRMLEISAGNVLAILQ